MNEKEIVSITDSDEVRWERVGTRKNYERWHRPGFPSIEIHTRPVFQIDDEVMVSPTRGKIISVDDQRVKIGVSDTKGYYWFTVPLDAIQAID